MTVQKAKDYFQSHKDLISTILVLVSAPLLAWILTLFVFQSYVVEGSSMETTLQNKDRLIVAKYKRTMSKITSGEYIPKRYEVIVFNHHNDTWGFSSGEDKQLIKRVIGLPGDRVVIKEGVVTVFNKENPDGMFVDRIGPENETQNVNVTAGNFDETISTGQLFVMGDNRANSLDSRVFGTISSDDIVGRAMYRVYPFDKSKKL